MKIFELSIGQEDYANMHLARLSILDVSMALGHSRHHWLMFEFDVDWGRRDFYFHRAIWPKRIQSEGFLMMLVRNCAPGWMDR